MKNLEEMKHVPHRIKNQSTQPRIDIFLHSADQLEIMQGGIVQAETAIMMMMFDEELQTTSTPPNR